MATALAYGLFMKSLVSKEVNLASDTLKVMLCTSAYTPSQDTHQYKSSITSEVTGTGYTAGGATLTTVTIPYDSATNKLSLKADNVTWSGSTITARYAVIYDSTPSTDATRPVIAYVDFGSDQITSAGDFVITWTGGEIVTLTVA